MSRRSRRHALGSLLATCAACVLAVACGTPHTAARAGRDAPATASRVPSSSSPTAGSTSAPDGHTRALTAQELDAIAELMQAAEQVRELRFVREVPVLVQDSAAIMGYVDGQLEIEDLERGRLIYTALGLLPPDLDVRALLLRLMGEQIVGYYDAEERRLIVRDDVMRAFASGADDSVDLAEARIVLVHELVHALQDQHLGLSARLDEQRDSDAENALHALVEGDATLAMIAFAMQSESVPLLELTSNPARIRSLSQLVQSSPLTGTELGAAPEIVRVPLLSAYVDGLTFVANLHGAGGWDRVDRAHADPPVSSEQILHPDRYVERDAPERVRFEAVGDALGSDYELIHEATLGELELSVYLGQVDGTEYGRRAASGWGGDRLYAYRAPDGGTALLWLTWWDTAHAATTAERAAKRVGRSARSSERAEHAVVRSGRALLIQRHVPAALQPAVRARLKGMQLGSSTPAAREQSD